MRAEIVHRDQHEAAGTAVLQRLVERGCKRLGQRIAVHLTGEAVETRQVGEALVAVVALRDRTHDAVRARRPPIRAREPAAVVFDPKPVCAIAPGQQAIFGLVGNAGAIIARALLHHGVVTRRRILRIEEARVAAAAGDLRHVRHLKHLGSVRPPGQRVGVDAPVVWHEPDGGEDAARVGCTIERIGRRVSRALRVTVILLSETLRRCRANLLEKS